MNKYVINKAKEMLEYTKEDWAKNFIVKDYQSQFDTPEAKKEVDAATFNMVSCDKKIEFLTKFIKANTKK